MKYTSAFSFGLCDSTFSFCPASILTTFSLKFTVYDFHMGTIFFSLSLCRSQFTVYHFHTIPTFFSLLLTICHLCSKVVVHKIVAIDILFYFMVVFFLEKFWCHNLVHNFVHMGELWLVEWRGDGGSPLHQPQLAQKLCTSLYHQMNSFFCHLPSGLGSLCKPFMAVVSFTS